MDFKAGWQSEWQENVTEFNAGWPKIAQPINLSVDQFINRSIDQSIERHIDMSIE